MKKIRDKVKGLSISLDKSTKLKELNPIIDKFKKETDKKYEVNVSLTFEHDQSTLHLKKVRKPYLKLVKK